MKKVLVVCIIILFFLGILGLLIFKLLPSGTQATPNNNNQAIVTFPVAKITSDSPQQVVTSCYTWYIAAYSTGATLETLRSKPEAAECFTNRFIQTWPQILQSTQSDPVLLSQATLSSWGSNIQTHVVGQSIRSVDVQITLGTGYAAMSLIAHTILDNDSVWKIDSVSLDSSQPAL